jgi:bacillolysin
MTSPTFNLSTAVGLKISFHFYAVSMETGEDFWVQYKNGSGNWVTVGSYVSGTNFNNNTFYASTITIPNFVPTSSGTLRILCDASDNNDNVYIDAVIITKLNTNLTGAPPQNLSIIEGHSNPTAHHSSEEIFVYPNPVSDLLHISYRRDIQAIRLLTANGQQIDISEESIADKQINTVSLAPGLYFLWVESAGEWYPARFIKL